MPTPPTGPGVRMKWLLGLVLLGAGRGCNLPVEVSLITASTPTASPTETPTAVRPTPPAPLGSADNPLVLALPPSTRPQGVVLSAGETLTSLLEKNTGYDFVSVIPLSESELIKGLATENADVASLSPFGYLLVSDSGDADGICAVSKTARSSTGPSSWRRRKRRTSRILTRSRKSIQRKQQWRWRSLQARNPVGRTEPRHQAMWCLWGR